MLKPISISLSPNTEKDDIWLAFNLLFQPWRWKKGEEINFLEEEFKNYLGVRHAFSFNSGRSSLMAILDSLNLEKGSEILLQAFTCNAVPNPILWSGLKPIYIDCDEGTFNIDIEDLEKTLRPFDKVQGRPEEFEGRQAQGKKPRALIVQHTFGLPADMDEITRICKENDLILIEDCAHALGAEYRGQRVGTFGKAAFFSFSRDKVISSVYGGMVATNDDILAERIKRYQEKTGYPSIFWVKQQLLHPILMNCIILPTYKLFGKYLLILLQCLHLLSKAVHWKEKRGLRPDYFPKRLPNALAILALNQFKKLEKFNQHRQKIANFYREQLKNTSFILPSDSGQIYPVRKSYSSEGQQNSNFSNGVYLRFTIKHHRAHEIIKKAWQENLLIGDWYDKIIAPHDTKLEKMKYEAGVCPKAEKLSKETLNLPTHINISEKDAQKIMDFLKAYGD